MWRKNNKPSSGQQRNQVRSGSIKDRSYEYYKAQRHQPNTKPIEISDTGRSKLRLLPSIIAVAVIVGSILYAMTLSVSPSVEMVEGQAPVYRSVEEYQQYAHQVMSEDLSSRTKFSVNTTNLEQALLDRFSELNAVSVRLPVLGRKPTITLSARQPAILLSNSANLYVLDQNGTVVSLAKDIGSEHLKNLQHIKDQSGIDIQIGDQAVTSGTVRFINELDAQFRDKELKISELMLPLSANELHVSLASVDYFIKFDISGDSRLQAGSYLAVRNELARQGITPEEYVDVRVEEKVFYK